jgi:hypothetical protein
MMLQSKTVAERAFEIARSKTARTLKDISRQLKQDGYLGVDAHLSGMSIKRQLRDECAIAHGETPPPRKQRVVRSSRYGASAAERLR